MDSAYMILLYNPFLLLRQWNIYSNFNRNNNDVLNHVIMQIESPKLPVRYIRTAKLAELNARRQLSYFLLAIKQY